MLHSLGVTGFDDIAGWDDAAIDRIDARLGQFSGRIRRDDWVTQARLLAAGDTSGFENRFGKL
jgi:predicted flap endonuclease-1-like 5' DNA nuclease